MRDAEIGRLAAALDVRRHTAMQLALAGLDEPAKVYAASDATLLAVPTVGERTLRHIRGLRRLRKRWNAGRRAA